MPCHRCTGDTERGCDIFSRYPWILRDEIEDLSPCPVDGIALSFTGRPAVRMVPQLPVIALSYYLSGLAEGCKVVPERSNVNPKPV